jgi:uncharacterized lipoprotein NlpE involved in copper resistance
MKKIILGLAMAAITLAGCNNRSNKSAESQNVNINTQAISQTDNKALATSSVADAKNTVSIKEIVSTYLQLKNALTDDNTTDAATAGTALEAAFKNFDKTALTAVQKKTFQDVEDDALEHADHIGKSGGNIAHQREHFDILSKDMYDLVKTFGGGQVLYKVFCPMYNNGKGAYWISEIKEIKNPYLGKAMPTCGSVQEELK